MFFLAEHTVMSEKQLMRFRVAEFLAHLTRDGGLDTVTDMIRYGVF